MDHSREVVVVTGGGSGIGLRAAGRLAADGHKVFIVCRDRRRGEDALSRINATAAETARLVLADLSEPDSLDAVASSVAAEADHLDALVNNAANFDQALREPHRTAAGHELIWATNHLGPFRLTAVLSGLLAAAPRPVVVTVASKGLVTTPRATIRFDHLDGAGWYTPTRAYYHSKLAQVMFSFELALRAPAKLGVACVRVPAVRLDADRLAGLPRLLRVAYAPKNRLAAPPEELAATYARIIRSHTDGGDDGGGPRGSLRGIYVDERLRPVKAPAHAYDAAARARLWSVTQEAAGDPRWAWGAEPVCEERPTW
ncbi:SDR family NAD(P)-dependent oxidoreductase [Saccharothrix longispora]|uniref:NAD(P)-dependent dehydrogenase (Short-subunit alcohol dehydrogenase family) n=1 Tax=Saccharothrix longispora TaxID=33920 RepID=A0ABU1PUI3_9PSEU|nr:SDR family NAD(P)-dependent oxidoreductase [Saccharothrix longispora]MDR6594303.1 NAD(P)-dependent dehydrogenase (short-subunit alcohol dehydrogenase family) [Saccharothrix longispora]